MTKEILTFLKESNLIEGVGNEGLETSIKAYNYLMQVKAPLQKKHILKTHRLLMQELYPEIAGRIRTVQVGIYSRGYLIKKCLEPGRIQQRLKICITGINKDNDITCNKQDKLKRSEFWCRLMHIEFESIHPFEDGNGRTGRLILNWHRERLGLPLLIIKDSEKQEYYKWFK